MTEFLPGQLKRDNGVENTLSGRKVVFGIPPGLHSQRSSNLTETKRLTSFEVKQWTTDADWSNLPLYDDTKALPDYVTQYKPDWPKLTTRYPFTPPTDSTQRYKDWKAKYSIHDENDDQSIRSVDARPTGFRNETPRSKPPTISSETQAQGRTHDTAKKHLWTMLSFFGKLYCIISRMPHPLESGHIIEKQCPYETLVLLYIALGGWFCRHSRLNIIPRR